MLLDFIVYGSFIALLIISLALNVLLAIKNKKVSDSAMNLILEKYILGKKLEAAITENESKKLEKDDGFVKFLSESRDQAFKYIEDVQNAIQEVSSQKRGTKEFNLAFKKLLSLLPDKAVKND